MLSHVSQRGPAVVGYNPHGVGLQPMFQALSLMNQPLLIHDASELM